MFTDDDVRRLGRAIHTVHQATDLSEFAHAAIDAARCCIESELVGVNEFDPRADRFKYVMAPREVQIPNEAELLQRYAPEHHPILRYVRETADGSARKISDFLTQEEFHRTPLWTYVYSKSGVEYLMSIALPSVHPQIVTLVMTRSPAMEDFSERDRRMLNALRPHLVQAYELCRERERVSSLVAGAAATLAADGSHVIVLSDPPQELTPGASALLHLAFGGSDREGLPPRVLSWLQRERIRWQATQDSCQDPKGLLAPIISKRHGRSVVMRLVPGPVVDCLVLRERLELAPAAELQRLGLTKREAEVLRHLIMGGTNVDIANRMHVQPCTVKAHLESTYRKLGVSSRAAAVTMAVDLIGANIRHLAD